MKRRSVVLLALTSIGLFWSCAPKRMDSALLGDKSKGPTKAIELRKREAYEEYRNMLNSKVSDSPLSQCEIGSAIIHLGEGKYQTCDGILKSYLIGNSYSPNSFGISSRLILLKLSAYFSFFGDRPNEVLLSDGQLKRFKAMLDFWHDRYNVHYTMDPSKVEKYKLSDESIISLYFFSIKRAQNRIEDYLDSKVFSLSRNLASIEQRRSEKVWRLALQDTHRVMENERVTFVGDQSPIEEIRVSLMELSEFVEELLTSEQGIKLSVQYHKELKRLYVSLGRTNLIYGEDRDRDAEFREKLEPFIDSHHEATFRFLKEVFEEQRGRFKSYEVARYLLYRFFTEV